MDYLATTLPFYFLEFFYKFNFWNLLVIHCAAHIFKLCFLIPCPSLFHIFLIEFALHLVYKGSLSHLSLHYLTLGAGMARYWQRQETPKETIY